MRVRIVSDGTGPGTRLTDDRGEKIDMVQSIEWRITHPRGLATATVTFTHVPVDVVGEVADE